MDEFAHAQRKIIAGESAMLRAAQDGVT